jgi:thermitase
MSLATTYISSLSTVLLAAANVYAGIPTDPIVPGQVIVRANTPKLLARAMGALSTQFADVAVMDQIEGRPIYLLSYGLTPTQTPTDVDGVITELITAGTIPWGELNYAGQTGEGKTDSLWLSGVAIGSNAFESQYAIPLLGVPLAHERSRGAGVVIAVIDTGIDASHPALGGSVSTQGVSFVDGTSNTNDDGDGADTDGDGLVDEQVGHGTFVAGIIHLVAPDAMLVPVRVLDSEGIAGNFQIARALAWSIDRGVHIANMSLGEDYRSQALEDIVAEADAKGVAVFGAAGNANTDDPREFPACDGSAVGVAALDWDDVKAPFSNFGKRIGLSAPGHTLILEGIPDLSKSIIGPVPGGGFAVWSGTSFSTAFASASAALVRAQHPEWPTQRVGAGRIRLTLQTILGDTGAPLTASNPSYGGLLGRARVSAANAVAIGPIAPARGDINADGTVDAADLSFMLEVWGPTPGGSRADLDASGDVGASDLSLLLYGW